MTKLHAFLLIILAATLGIGSAWLAYTQWYVVDTQTTTIRFQVTEGPHIGFAVDTGELAFGKVPQGGTGERRATLESYVASRAHISIQGTPWVSVSEPVLDLEPGVPQQVTFTLQVPEDAPPGNYTGTMRIVYTRRP